MIRFDDLNLSSGVMRSIANLGFEEATPIQEQAIPVALSGGDLIGMAPTGTGKTVAFGIPLMERLTKDSMTPQGVVILPTRELAIQVAEELNKLGQYRGIRALPIYGGQDISRQIKGMKKRPEIVVGTPGRLMDHMRRKTIRLDSVKIVVLDEADEMLNMGFIDDIRTILTDVPNQRQTLLFSASIPKQIEELAGQFMKDPRFIRVTPKKMTVPTTEQHYIELHEKQKFDVLCNLLDSQSPDATIVFGRTKRRVDELAEALNKRGYSAEGIHGDLTQAKRDMVMGRFRQGIIDILVATDLAARGLDITGVTHVFNFDIPQDAESYVHRIGRTGRAGRDGVAITFISPRERDYLRLIERTTNSRITRQPIPTMTDALATQQQVAVERLLRAAEENHSGTYRMLAEDLLNREDSVTLVTAALRLLTREPDTTPVKITEEKSQHFGKAKSRKPQPSGHNPRKKRQFGKSYRH